MPVVLLAGQWTAVSDTTAEGIVKERLDRAEGLLVRSSSRDRANGQYLLDEAESILEQLEPKRAASSGVLFSTPTKLRPSLPPPSAPAPRVNPMLEALTALAASSVDDKDVPKVTVRRLSTGKFETKGYGHRRVFDTYEAADAAGLILALTARA